MTYNEEVNLHSCLSSIRWVDELIVIDTGSTDRTVEIAKKFTRKIFNIPFDGNFARIREKSVSLVKNRWVFILDADETVAPGTEKNIRKAVTLKEFTGFLLPRRQYINRVKYLQFGYFYPDYQLRLFRSGYKKYTGSVHARPEIPEEEVGILNNVEIRHNSSRTKYNSFLSLRKVFPYVRYEGSEIAGNRAIRVSLVSGITEVFRHTYRSFIRLKGYKDGYFGLRAALIHGIYQGLIIIYAVYLRRKRPGNNDS